MFNMLGFILFFILLFIVDIWIGTMKNKSFTKAEITFSKLKIENPSFYKKFNSLYGKEWDELHNKPMHDINFPISLFINIKDIEKLNYFTERMRSEM